MSAQPREHTMVVFIDGRQYEVPLAVRDELIALRQRCGAMARTRYFVELWHHDFSHYKHLIMYADSSDAVLYSDPVVKLQAEGWSMRRIREIDPHKDVVDF